jgi:hypothetical protein
MKLGIEKTAIVRVRSGISYALTEGVDEGHCGLPTEELIPLAEKLLEVATGAHPHRARSRAGGGHGGRRPGWRNAVCISGRLASGGAHHRRAAEHPQEPGLGIPGLW